MRQYEIGQGPRCLFGNMDRLWVLAASTPPYVSSPVAFDGGELVCYSWQLLWTFLRLLSVSFEKKKYHDFTIRKHGAVVEHLNKQGWFKKTKQKQFLAHYGVSITDLWKLEIFVFISLTHCEGNSLKRARGMRDPTGCRCWVSVIRCNPTIMSDYDTLAPTYRDTKETPVSHKASREAPVRLPAFLNLWTV